MTFRGTIAGIAGVDRLLHGLGDEALDRLEVGVARGVLGGQSIVRGNARGRPGPRAPTGDFNRSIVGDSERAGNRILGQIGTNAAQALRLEFGFIGKDRLDRYYNQPPYPYLSRSIGDVEKMILAEVEKALDGLGR